MATQNRQQLLQPRRVLDLDLDLDLALAQATDFPFAEAQRPDHDVQGALADWAAWKQNVEIPMIGSLASAGVHSYGISSLGVSISRVTGTGTGRSITPWTNLTQPQPHPHPHPHRLCILHSLFSTCRQPVDKRQWQGQCQRQRLAADQHYVLGSFSSDKEYAGRVDDEPFPSSPDCLLGTGTGTSASTPHVNIPLLCIAIFTFLNNSGSPDVSRPPANPVGTSAAVAVTSPTYNPWEGQQQQLSLITPYTMQSQQRQPYQPHNYDPYYTPSTSTESTPPNGFVPYYIDPAHASLSPLHPNGPISPYPAGILSPSSPTSPPTPGTAALSDPEAEQKRLRNTAASARFRAKKKMREQSLERVSQERRTLLSRLEGRVKELEEENKWLKNLVWEKRDAREERELRLRRGEIDGVDGEGEGKREGDRNDGVGTSGS
ncbi:uncharacterized protein BP5553_03007 [Venustampulla echinocandica]|uniref:BZIP domain-containing protein n=1 Tax=Venustampulla echinocandica TaxID=2656787 RepID=A0A370TT20_9HELO|nr:uncharacterized protein BP5553_03007 [Venustampulla echinocandica]RDL38667.1 hypothetical protein BP5553_03007 [Venustampulla echinocandica]